GDCGPRLEAPDADEIRGVADDVERPVAARGRSEQGLPIAERPTGREHAPRVTGRRQRSRRGGAPPRPRDPDEPVDPVARGVGGELEAAENLAGTQGPAHGPAVDAAPRPI